MKGDFTRDTFDPARHFSRVLMQQGRVQLDADWNEQAAILLHYLETLAADLIGPHGGPAGKKGFEIQVKAQSLIIGAGRYYVDGILCENETPCTYDDQPDFPLVNLKTNMPTFWERGSYAVYLDVWERHITDLDDNLIREVALGGPDTATRAKVVWQVKLMPAVNCDDIYIPLADLMDPKLKGPMQAHLVKEDAQADPCITAPDSKYRGAENQLYRVEIHEVIRDGTKVKSWTFKWSRENGSIVAAWLGNNEDGGLVVSSVRGFEAGGWVEITSEIEELNNLPGKLTRVIKVEGDALYLESGPEKSWDPASLVKIRRWDQREGGDVKWNNGAVQGVEDIWIDLEDGIQVFFESGNDHFSGDYWLIPARVATGEIEWPLVGDKPASLPPRGIQHHFAPLAIVQSDSTQFNWIQDCRRTIDYLGKETAA